MAIKKSELYSSLWQSCDELRGRLGHSNSSVTLTIYAHTTVDMQEEAASLMDDIVTPIPVEIKAAEIMVQKSGK